MALTALSRAAADAQNNGGVKKMYFANRADVSSMTKGSGATLKTYTAVSMSGSTFWYEQQCEIDSVEATFEIKTNGRSPSSVVTKIVGYIPLLNAANTLWLEELRKAAATGVVVLVEFYNGQKLVFGYDELMGTAGSLVFREGQGAGGKTSGDPQGVQITLEGMQIETPYNYTFTPAVS